MSDHADDDHALNAELLELLVEVRVGEPARPPVLVHDDVALLRLEIVVSSPTPPASVPS
jgi:hypothetical protein